MADPLAPSPTTPEAVATLLQSSKCRWLGNDEVFLLLTNQAEFGLSISNDPPTFPAGGTLFLIDKRACRFFRRDGHNWRKKKDGKSVAESHMDLRVGDAKRLYCTYTTAEDLPLKRRCYWLLECPELEHLVLMHYLHSSGSSRRAPSNDISCLSADVAARSGSAITAAGSRGSGSLGDASSAELLLGAGSGSMGSGQLPVGVPGQGVKPQPAVQGEDGIVWASVPAPLPGCALGSGEVMAQVGSSGGLALAQPVALPAAQQAQQQHNPNPGASTSPSRGAPLGERSYERQISGAFRKMLSLEPERQHQQRSAEAGREVAPVVGQAWPQPQLGLELPPEHLLLSLQSAGLSLLNSLLSGEFDPTDLPPFDDLTPDGHDVWAPGSLHPHPEQPQTHLPATGAGLPVQPSPGAQTWQLPAANAELLQLLGTQAEQLPVPQAPAVAQQLPDTQALPATQQQQLPAPEAGVLQPGGLTWQGSELERFFKQLEEGEEQRRQQEGAGQGEGETGAVEPYPAGQRGSAEGTAGGSGGSGVRSLNKLDSTLSWLAPLRRMLSGAGASAPKLPSWLPDLSLDAPTQGEGQGQRGPAGEAVEAGSSLDGHVLALSPGDGASAQEAEAPNPPVMLPRQRRRMQQQLAAAQEGPGGLEKGAQVAPGKSSSSMLGRRRGLEKQGSAVPGPSQRLRPGEEMERGAKQRS